MEQVSHSMDRDCIEYRVTKIMWKKTSSSDIQVSIQLPTNDKSD
jgi:hypothetical protein